MGEDTDGGWERADCENRRVPARGAEATMWLLQNTVIRQSQQVWPIELAGHQSWPLGSRCSAVLPGAQMVAWQSDYPLILSSQL